MFRQNVPKRDYQVRLSHDPDFGTRTTSSVGCSIASTCTSTWGTDFIAGVTGVQMYGVSIYGMGDTTGSGQATIITPGGTFTHSFTSFNAGCTLRLDFFGVQLSVSGMGTDCGYSFSFDSFNAYWEEGSLVTPVLTFGPSSDSGFYDGRLNIAAAVQAEAHLNPEPVHVMPSCPSPTDFPTIAPYGYDALDVSTGGYRWRLTDDGSGSPGSWVNDQTELGPRDALVPSDCDCTVIVPSIGWEDVVHPSSWRMVCTARDSDYLSIRDLGEKSCDCPPDVETFVPGIFHVKYLDRTQDTYSTNVSVVPINWGIPTETLHREAGCGDTSEYVPGTVDEDDTSTMDYDPNICPLHEFFEHTVSSVACSLQITPQACGPSNPDGGGGGD